MAYSPPKLIDAGEACRRLRESRRAGLGEYYAFFSTWLDGIVTEPWLAVVPLDDHLVHRGDGVFEAAKCLAGRIYQFERHLERLGRSAGAVGLEPPMTTDELRETVRAVVRAGGHDDCLVRLYLSRGTGGFTTNPFECPARGLYVTAGPVHDLPDAAYERGVSLGISDVPGKSAFYASVKSCNYLPNVLLKRDALTKGWDFAVGRDENGDLSESSTENVGLVDGRGFLVVPRAKYILQGITLGRALELARDMIAEGLLAGVEHANLGAEDLKNAREVMLFGTTLEVMAVTSFEGRPVGDGKPGPVARELRRRMRKDIFENPAMSTPVRD